MEDRLEQLDRLDRLDCSHNAGYFETNDSDLELSEGEMCVDLAAYSSGDDANQAKELKIKSEQFELDMDKELSDMIGDMGYPTYLLNHLTSTEDNEKDEKYKPNTAQDKDNDIGFYDNIYFDSDTEVDDDMDDTKSNKRVLTNDELFYDPNADDLDEEWVNTQRMTYRNIKTESEEGKDFRTNDKPKSDAILSCPCCMVTLCIDCQQHDSYKNQFRAMFVMHSIVDTGENLKFKRKKPKIKFKERHLTDTNEVEFDIYHPVRCGSCQTEVGVFDGDEVYHFYNVLPSEP